MNKDLHSMSEAPDESRVEFSTRLIELQNAEPDRVLPFVIAVLDGIGLGTAQAVKGVGGTGGILLTTPVGVSHFLESAINNHLDKSSLERYFHAVHYPPVLIIPSNDEAIQRSIDALELLPPDMNCNIVNVDDSRSAIVVSGPASRRADFTSDILPSLNSLVHGLEKPGFPVG